MQPTILTIAGSDSSGGAGAQADLKAIAACGAHGACVLTAVTAQNTQRVDARETLSPGLVLAQIDAVFADLDVVAVKTGMLASETTVQAVADGLQHHGPPALVVDPVIVSTSGTRLLTPAGVDAMVERLFPLATVVTPNVDEAEWLSGLRPRDTAEAEEAGRRILDRPIPRHRRHARRPCRWTRCACPSSPGVRDYPGGRAGYGETGSARASPR